MENTAQASDKKVLLISYHFPPNTAIGGLRTAKFSKNLSLLGWNVSVLTIKEHYLLERDPELLQGLNDVKIIRTTLLPTLDQLYLRLKKIYLRLRTSSFQEKSNGNISEKQLIESAPISDKQRVEGNEKLIHKIKRYIVSLLLALPDSERNWIIPATFSAMREIKREKIDCIITTSPPPSVNLIGLLLKSFTGVKWIADFRDPWLGDNGKRLFLTCALSLKIERYLEKKVMQKADSILTTTELLRDKYQNQYDDLPKEKFLTIYSGYEKNAFSMISTISKFEKFTLTYAGTLYLDRTPESIFNAINKLIKQNKIDRNKISIKLIGNCEYIDGYPTAEMIHSYGLESIVEVLKPVPYSKVLEVIGRSHIAMLFAINQPLQIPGKIFDYIGAGTPVLALSELGSATANFVNSWKIGKAFYPDDVEGISDFLFQSITNSTSVFCDNDEARSLLEIKSITKCLDDHLNTIVFSHN